MESQHSFPLSGPESGKPSSTFLVAAQIPDWSRIVEWSVLVGLSALFIGHSLVPAWRTLNSEFPDYYLAAELYHQNIPLDRVYEWTWFQRQNDHWGVRDGLVSFAPNPPTVLLPLIPLTRLNPRAAKRAWILASLVLLGLSLWVLRQVTSLNWRRLILICLLCILPLSVDFLFARHYVLILFLVCTAYYAACRDRDWTCGVMCSAAAAMKLFPALAVILFVRKRNWKALAGFVAGAAALVGISVGLFGIEVHRVFLSEVLSQASRGDWLGPYALSQNSFITLWSRLFLVEPELNPSPWISSPILYAVALATTLTILVFAFLHAVDRDKTPRANALHWATLIPLLLLLSTTTAPDYSCLLVFTAIIGIDALLAARQIKTAPVLLLLYVAACAPIPGWISTQFPLTRLIATTSLYAVLLRSASAGRGYPAKRWLAAGFVSVAVLTVYNLHTVRNRGEDFSGRLSTYRNGYRFANPVSLAQGVAITEMQPGKYGAVFLTDGAGRDIQLPGDVLSITGSAAGTSLYAELASRKSLIVSLPVEPPGSSPETLTEGQEPSLSPNGRWLAFIREEQGRRTVWLRETNSMTELRPVLSSAYQPLDVTVTDEGDVIAASGKVSDPRLLLVKHSTWEVSSLSAFPHPARYPAVSPDGKRLAFSRRDDGSWHLVVRTFAPGYERQLTHASCNAVSPSWENAQTLLYATDCGRGVGLSAIARVVVPN